MSFTSGLKSIIGIIMLFALFAFLPTISKHLKDFYQTYLDPKPSVAVITIKGVLYDSSDYTRYLHKYFKDDDIKAIVLKIECPGSAAGTGQAIFNEILTLKKKHPKPIITLVENMCASGGYYIACATDHIIASSAAIVGSIGTCIPYLFQFKKFMDEHHIDYVSLKSGAYKTATDPFTTATPEEKAMLQELLDDTYEQFTRDVARQRTVAMNDRDSWANGKIFTGSQALALGLIDEVGAVSAALAVIQEKALIENMKDVRWVKPPKKTGLYAWLDDSSDKEGLFSHLLGSVCTFLEQRYSSSALRT